MIGPVMKLIGDSMAAMITRILGVILAALLRHHSRLPSLHEIFKRPGFEGSVLGYEMHRHEGVRAGPLSLHGTAAVFRFLRPCAIRVIRVNLPARVAR